MNDKIIQALVCAIAGLMLGYMLGGAGGTSTSEAERAQAAAAESLGAEVQELTERLAALESGIGGRLDALADGVSGQVAALSEKVDAMPGTVSAEIEKSASALGTALSAEIAALSDRVGTIETGAAQAAAPAASGETPAPAASGETPAPAQAEVAPEPAGFGVGETVTLLDGDARVFISSVDNDAGTARVAVNGFDIQTVGAWHTATFELGDKVCTVVADSVVNGKVMLSAACEE